MKFLGEESMNAVNITHITWSYMKTILFQMFSKTYIQAERNLDKIIF